MHEIHTGHLPKPQFATVRGPLEMQRQPQRAQIQTVEYIAPRKQLAVLYLPPVMKYSHHYSRVENRFNDLNKELYPPEED
ncbi:unnamed protein product [Orchesella dallaii]|uniref:Uncharacterized protein n=1 Tax=Orchesella dallaii TaxID=48710 RepID=A0ABP1Q654_9HEXA